MRRRALAALSITNRDNGGTESPQNLQHQKRTKRDAVVGTMGQGEDTYAASSQGRGAGSMTNPSRTVSRPPIRRWYP
jgi:hypothetical protein